MKKAIINILVVLNVLFAIALLLSYYATIISPSRFWIPTLFGLAYPYLLFVNLLFVLLWLFIEPFKSIISIVIIVLGFNHVTNYFQLSKQASDAKGIDCLSFNVKNFSDSPGSSHNEKIKNVVNYIEDQDVNIVCLQEAFLYGLSYDQFKLKHDGENLPTYGCQLGSHILMSDYPIIHKQLHKFKDTKNQISIVDLIVSPADTMRVFNCHLQSYSFTRGDISSLDSISSESRAIEQGKTYIKKLKAGFIKRSEQVAELKKLASQSPYPFIICGDFNDTPVSYTYHTIVGDSILDAFVESGTGIGNTYVGKLPSFRIDYILHSSYYKAVNYTTGNVVLSDHYPIRCTLVKD